MATRPQPGAIDGRLAHLRPGHAPSGAPLVWEHGLPALVGARLTLREPQAGDGPHLVDALSNEAVGRFMSRPPDSVAGFERFIAWVLTERRAGRCFCYTLVPADTGHAAGLIQFRAIEPGFGSAEWGFALSPRNWGTGLFMEGARMAVDYAFRSIGIHRLEARASVVNGRGNGVLRKIGAVPEGVLRQSLRQAGTRVDQVLWAMLDDDWFAAPPPDAYAIDLPAEPAPPPAHLPPRPPASRPAWCDGLPMLECAECVIREIDASDADDLRHTLADPEVRRYTSPAPSTVEGFARFVAWSHEERHAGRYGCFVIVARSTGRAVGLVQLRALEPSFQTAEWGFAIGRPYWGTGLFPAAARLVLGFAFGTLGVHRLEARSVVANEAAIRRLRSFGAVFEGTLRRSFLIGGQYHDDALCSLLAQEWRRRTGDPPRAVA